jgi:hypothetical protein
VISPLILLLVGLVAVAAIAKAWRSLPMRKASPDDRRVTFGPAAAGVLLGVGLIAFAPVLAALLAGGSR